MTAAEITAACYRGEEASDEIPDVTLWEISGFSFDMTVEEDQKLFAIVLEALNDERT